MTQTDARLENERIVRAYFEKPRWEVTKLDTGKEEAADYRVCRTDGCFLCEVKTIESDLESRPPGSSGDYFLAERSKQRDAIDAHLGTHPDVHVVLIPGQWEYLYGPEDKFRQRYDRVHRSKLSEFEVFSRELKQHLRGSSVGDTPYMVRVDSDDLYVPGRKLRDKFFYWLESELLAIASGKASPTWHIERSEPSRTIWYSTSYTIHAPQPEQGEDWHSTYNVTVIGPKAAGVLDVDVHGYGKLSYENIDTNVAKASRQLAASAARERDSQMPRVIVVALKSNLDPDDWFALKNCVAQLFDKHANLSAIAVLRWTPDTAAPPANASIQAWIKYLAVPAVPSFIVYHNTNVQDVRPVPWDVFWDKWSVHDCFQISAQGED